MATYTHGTRTTVRHEWKIPDATYGGHGAAIEEVLKAISAARVAYTDLHGAEPFYDDWLRVYAADNEVILFFETDAPALSPGRIILPEMVIARAGAQTDDWIITNVHATCYGCDVSYAAGCAMYVDKDSEHNFRQLCVDCHRAEKDRCDRLNGYVEGLGEADASPPEKAKSPNPFAPYGSEEMDDDLPMVCVQHLRFVPCRIEDGCQMSQHPDAVLAVRVYQEGRFDQ